MAGQYNNMIKELIIQSRLNSKLINEVNNRLDGNTDYTFEELKERHQERVDREYANAGFDNLPIYDYFDGTQLINSLFSTVVVPVEYLKGRLGRFNTDLILKQTNYNLYSECEYRIIRLHDVVNTFYRTSHISVFHFFTHIRNALCHSGNGNIHFFPDGGRDIRALYFYDEKSKYGNDGNLIERKVFLAQLNIFDELIPLVLAFDNLIIELAQNDNRQLDMQSIEARIEEALRNNR